MINWILQQLNSLPSVGVYLLVALLVFGEAALFIGFVIPGETSVIVGGVIASQGRVNIVGLCVAVVLSAIVGDSVGYAIGKRYGQQILELKILRRRRAALDRALEGLRKRGPTYVIAGRFTAFLRAVMPGLAGISKMHYRRFLIANAIGGILWGAGFALIGFLAGHALHRIEKAANWVGVVLLILFGTVLTLSHVRSKRREEREETVWEAKHPD
jgi:membrane protein DedA with SNARE-associated domain